MYKTIAIVAALILLSGASLWWRQQQNKQQQEYFAIQPQSATQPSADRSVAVHRGDGFEFNYPEGWYVSPIYENPSSTTLPLVVTKYPAKDYGGIIISERPNATLEDIRRELQETVAQPLVEGAVDGEPSLRTFAHIDAPEMLEEVILITAEGAVRFNLRRSPDDVERYEALLLIAKTFKKN